MIKVINFACAKNGFINPYFIKTCIYSMSPIRFRSGKTWMPKQRGGQRAAIAFIHANAGGVPLDSVALIGGDPNLVSETGPGVTSP